MATAAAFRARDRAHGRFSELDLLLSIAAFSLSLIGTFLVRSGVLSSVHAFANDPERGVFILWMLVIAIGGALALFAWRAPKLESGTAFEPVSRESALLLNNVLLTAAAATVFIGTLYPLFLDALNGTKISVGPPYFARTFAPLMVALLVLVPFGPALSWKRGDLKAVLRVLAPGLGAAALAVVIVLFLWTPHVLAACGAFALAAWVIGATLADFHRRPGAWHARPASTYASALAHIGLAVTLLGVTGTTLWRSEGLEVLKPGGTMQVAQYQLTLDAVNGVRGPNYDAERATITVRDGGETLAVMHPEKRVYPIERQATAETAIRTTGFGDPYLALGDRRGDGWQVRAFGNPLATFIWLGGGLMAPGGLASLWGRLRKRDTATRKAASVTTQ